MFSFLYNKVCVLLLLNSGKEKILEYVDNLHTQGFIKNFIIFCSLWKDSG